MSERFLRVLAQHDNDTGSMGTPVSFTGAQLTWRPFLGTLCGCRQRVPRQRGETRNTQKDNNQLDLLKIMHSHAGAWERETQERETRSFPLLKMTTIKK